MNALARRIQFRYHDFEWGKQIFKDIICNMPEKCIVDKRFFCSDEVYEIYLLDGSKILIAPLSCTVRERADDIYLQKGISQEELEIIQGQWMGGNLRILTQYKDLFRSGKGFSVR